MDAYDVVFRYRTGRLDSRAESRASGDGGRFDPPVDVQARPHSQHPMPGMPYTDLAT